MVKWLNHFGEEERSQIFAEFEHMGIVYVVVKSWRMQDPIVKRRADVEVVNG